MDANNFKKSQDFSNVERNKEHNPALKSGDHDEYLKAYKREMRDTKQNATQEGFMARAKNECPPDDWDNKQKEYDDAWENNKNSPQDEDDL
ncbi:MAG: hypothetical protein K0M63_12060 [Weeksellaceae bacterium]|nr:hypothetical protein [Weeksellaceae bacterium]